MNRHLSGKRSGPMVLAALALAASLVWSPTATASELEETLSQVGPEYAQAYLAPFSSSYGANINSGLYTTAYIGKSKISIEFGLKAAATHLNESDQYFTKYVDVTLDESIGIDPTHPLYGEQGVAELAGTTVLGNTDNAGTATIYVNGVPVESIDTIAGIWETRWVPLAIPEASVGGIFGFRGTLRLLPEVKVGDLGKLKFYGFGISFGVNSLIETLPLDISVGYFKQKLELGSIIESDANSFYLALSKSFTAVTVYGGGAIESSTMKVGYIFDGPEGPVSVSFEDDGIMDSRLTLGATLTFGIRLNAEVNVGKLAVYSAGLMFGF